MREVTELHQPTDWAILQAMKNYGGSFAQAIAEACECADSKNFAALKTALPDLWYEYTAIASLLHTKGTGPK
jgi:DNA polymerase/3'-5' exonuclease PolX